MSTGVLGVKLVIPCRPRLVQPELLQLAGLIWPSKQALARLGSSLAGFDWLLTGFCGLPHLRLPFAPNQRPRPLDSFFTLPIPVPNLFSCHPPSLQIFQLHFIPHNSPSLLLLFVSSSSTSQATRGFLSLKFTRIVPAVRPTVLTLQATTVQLLLR